MSLVIIVKFHKINGRTWKISYMDLSNPTVSYEVRHGNSVLFYGQLAVKMFLHNLKKDWAVTLEPSQDIDVYKITPKEHLWEDILERIKA